MTGWIITSLNEDSPAPILNLIRQPSALPAPNKLFAGALAIPKVALVVTGFATSGLWFIPGVCTALCIHEVGRLASAAAARIPPQIGGSATWRSLQRQVYARTGGRILFSNDSPPSTRRMFPALSGGLLSTIIFAILTGGASVKIDEPLFRALFVAATLVIVASLIPSRPRRNFGALLWLAMRRPPQFRSCLAWSVLDGQNSAGIRPRDQDSNLLRLALAADRSTPEYAAASLMAFYRDIDFQNFDGAVQQIENALAASHVDSTQRFHIWFEAAWASAALQRNPHQARVWLDRARSLGKLRYENSVQAEIARCEENYRDAAEYFAASRAQFAKEKLDSGVVRLALEWFAGAERECRTALST